MKTLSFLSCVLVFFVLAALPATSQTSVDESIWDNLKVKDLSVQVEEAKADIHDLTSAYHLSMLFWLVLVLFGLATAILGVIFSAPQTPAVVVVIVAVIGVLVASFTSMDQTLVGVNFKSMRGFYEEGQTALAQMNRRLVTLRDPLADSPYYKEFRDKYKEVISIYEKFIAARDGQTSSTVASTGNPASFHHMEFSLAMKAYAKSELLEPKWITSIPSDKDYLYSLGKATSLDYDKANEEALNNAKEDAYKRIRALFTSKDASTLKQIDRIASFLSQHGIIADRYVRIVSSDEPVTAFVLLKIPKTDLKKVLSQFELENGVRIKSQIYATLQKGIESAK